MNFNKRSFMLVIFGAILLSACGSTPQRRFAGWAKPGATQSDLQKDKDECVYQVSAATQGTDYGYQTILVQELDRYNRQSDLYMKCMVAKQWAPQFF